MKYSSSVDCDLEYGHYGLSVSVSFDLNTIRSSYDAKDLYIQLLALQDRIHKEIETFENIMSEKPVESPESPSEPILKRDTSPASSSSTYHVSAPVGYRLLRAGERKPQGYQAFHNQYWQQGLDVGDFMTEDSVPCAVKIV